MIRDKNKSLKIHNEFPDKKYIAEVEDGFVVEEMEDED